MLLLLFWTEPHEFYENDTKPEGFTSPRQWERKRSKRGKGKEVPCCEYEVFFSFFLSKWPTKRRSQLPVSTIYKIKVYEKKEQSIKIKKYMKADTFMCFNATCISLRSNFHADVKIIYKHMVSVWASLSWPGLAWPGLTTQFRSYY